MNTNIRKYKVTVSNSKNMIILNVNNISYSVGVKDILKNITFSVNQGDRLAVIGVNGSGKSTLLRLICGIYTPENGEISIAKNKTIGFMEQNDAFNTISGKCKLIDNTVLGQMYAAFPGLCEAEERLTLLEEKMSSSSGSELDKLSAEFSSLNTRYIENGGLEFKARAKSFLVSLGFPEEYHSLEASSLSGGQRTRLTLARLLYSAPDILILDEPTNHLDTDTLVWLENHLSAYKKTLIVVSHDRYFLNKVTNKTLDIENHCAVLYKCGYSEYLVQKESARAALQKKYDIQQKEIKRLEAFIENQRKWNRERNIIAAESREKAIARMEKVEKPADAPREIGFSFRQGIESGNDVLSIKNLKMGFGNNILFTSLSFDVKKHERIFILGPNGCGKSTLISIIMNKLRPLAGNVIFGHNVEIGYYDQENQNLNPDNTILDELWSMYPDMTPYELRKVLAMFSFRGDDVEKKVSVLSGGERARLTLAKLIFTQMNLLVLDEPTNHLDVSSREALEKAILDFNGTVIAVSHDRYFIDKLATRIIVLNQEKTEDIPGGYIEYLKYIEASEKKNAITYTSMPQQTSSKSDYLKRKEEAAAIRKREKRKLSIKDEIKKLEDELIEVNEELFGEAGTDYMKAAELEDNRIIIEDRLMQLYEEEEELEKPLIFE